MKKKKISKYKKREREREELFSTDMKMINTHTLECKTLPSSNVRQRVTESSAVSLSHPFARLLLIG